MIPFTWNQACALFNTSHRNCINALLLANCVFNSGYLLQVLSGLSNTVGSQENSNNRLQMNRYILQYPENSFHHFHTALLTKFNSYHANKHLNALNTIHKFSSTCSKHQLNATAKAWYTSISPATVYHAINLCCTIESTTSYNLFTVRPSYGKLNLNRLIPSCGFNTLKWRTITNRFQTG